MREDYRLLTPENVELRYDVAGVGSRLFAASLDYTFIAIGYAILFFAATFVLAGITRLVSLNNDLRELSEWVAFGYVAVNVLLAFVAFWGYFIAFELLWNGQSPGKRILGLRTVRQGGLPISATASLVRNLLRAIDVLLLVGVVVMLFDRSSRRLGDLAAGTLVVREPRAVSRDAFETVDMPRISDERIEALPNPSRLTMAHYTLIRDYFARQQRLPGRRAELLAAHVADDIARVLEVPKLQMGDPVLFLATAARAFEQRHKYYDGGTSPEEEPFPQPLP
jgi:uncharacterized RDD family membrane protein YckC